MIELSDIDSYHEILINVAYHGCACSICAQIIQRILWCYNGFCDFYWNHIQRILCSSGAIRLPAEDIRDDLTQTSHWFGQKSRGRNITTKIFFNFDVYIRELLCSQELQNPLQWTSRILYSDLASWFWNMTPKRLGFHKRLGEITV